MRETIEPTTDEKGIEHHPAFGKAVVSRRSSTGTTLFDSDLLHHEVVTLTISEASRKRELNTDWIHGGKELIEIQMSTTQWGALITSMNYGDGVPVTLTSLPDRPLVPGLPHAPRLQTSLDEIKNSVSNLVADLRTSVKDLEETIEAKKGIRAVRESLGRVKGALRNAEANSVFTVTSLQEAAEHVVTSARAEIDALLTRHGAALGSATVATPALEAGEVLEEVEAED